MKKKQDDTKIRTEGGRESTRARILSAALKLLNEGGRDAVTTRAVAELAGVQPPVLYRLFIDKDGLLTALAEHGFTLYLAQKRSEHTELDPVEALRSGWDRHIQFGLGHPSLYLLMYAQPHLGQSPAADLSFAMLHRHMSRVAAAGRLRIPEAHAVTLFHSAAVGMALTLLRSQQDAPDITLSNMARDNTLSMITVMENVPCEQSPISAAATTLDAGIGAEDGFTPGEFALFKEWLRRLRSS